MVALSLIMLLGFGARTAYLLHATSQPRYQWDDPDHYELKGRLLARDGAGWRWTFDAVRHSSYDQRFYVLPPAYPVFLSLFALFPGYPFTAQVGQVFLSTLTIALLFVLGRQLHSPRAGLIAAAIYACWVPNIIAVWSTMQESLYIPLVVLAFAVLVRASAPNGQRHARQRSGGFALAGLVFGVATLTRSIPMYALPVLAAVSWYRHRKASLRYIAALFAGFFLVTLPYSAALTQHLGRLTFVENHGSIFIVERYGLEGDDPASLTDTTTLLVSGFAAAPVATLGEWWDTTRSMLHVNGGRLLQIYLGAETKLGAAFAKWITHLFGDATFIVSLVVAPIGAALARDRTAAMFLVMWIVVNVGLVALSGFGGARLRAGFEPHLVALAAVVLARDFDEVNKKLVVAAGLVSIVLGAIVAPQLSLSLSARADYGVHWPMKAPPKRSAMTGSAGFNVLPAAGTLRFHVRPRNRLATNVTVRLNGRAVETVRIAEREHRFEVPWTHGGLVHVELTASDAATGEPVRVLVIVPKPA